MRAHCKSDETKQPQPYLKWNRCIVDSTDRMIAFPNIKHEVWKSGTWATVRYAKKVGKYISIIYPDGTSEAIVPKD